MTPGKTASQKSKSNAGSPNPGEPALLLIGFLRRPHGIRGEILMEVFPDLQACLHENLEIFIGSSQKPHLASDLRPHQLGFITRLTGIEDRTTAGLYRNQPVYLSENDLPVLPPGQYYRHQLVGLAVRDEQNNSLGVLEEILITGANDVYIVRTSSGEEQLMPAIPQVILKIDLEHKTMTVRLQEWA